MALSKEGVLRHSGTFVTEEVHVPAWADADGDDVILVRGMTVREFELQQSNAGKEDKGTSAARLLARCALDETGGRLFTDRDVPQIAELPLKQILEVTNVISRLSGLIDEDKDDEDEASDDEQGEQGDEGKAPESSPSSTADSVSPPTSSVSSSSELRAI